LSTGLDHYLRSLEALKAWGPDIALTLGGHHEPVEDLSARIDAICQLHQDRLARVQELLAEPRTIAEISGTLFGEVSGYNVLLAVEEAGAHVEYLYQRGLLSIANLAELDAGPEPAPIRYLSRASSPPRPQPAGES
jgi:glyoxylase-like metal-dependent hydrolase (beta-lactamase superfamily II)